MKLTSKLTNFNSLMGFLVLECFAILSFALGGVNTIFYALGILIALFTAFFAYNKFSKNELPSLLLYMGVMIVISILSTMGNFLRETQGLSNILPLIAINALLFAGMAARKIEGFKPETLLLVIGFSLALLVVISMVYSWTQYGFFYAVRFKDSPIYYYDAKLYDVTNEGLWLTGFNFQEVSISYSGLFGVLLTCYLAGLLFISPKQESKKFFMFLAIGLVGLIYLITIPNLVALAFLIPTLLVVLCYRFLRGYKVFKSILIYSLIAVSGLALIFFIIAYINASGATGLTSFIASNGALNRIFNNNGWMMKANEIMKATLSNNNFFGIHYTNYLNHETLAINSRMFELELLKEGGLFAIIFVVAFVVLTAISLAKYLKNSKDSDLAKVLFLVLIVSFFIYSSFNYDAFPLVHETGEYSSFFQRPITLVMIGMIGYIYHPILLKDGTEYGKVQEEVKEENNDIVIPDDDYSFKEDNYEK